MSKIIYNASRNKRPISPNSCDMALPCKIRRYSNNNEINSDSLPGLSIDTNIAQSSNSNISNTGITSNKSSLEDTDYTIGQRTDAKHNAKHKSRYSTTKRGIILIKTLHLPARRGRLKSSDRKKRSTKDSNKDSSKNSKAWKTSEEKSRSSSTTGEKMQNLKKILEDRFYNKKQSKVPSKQNWTSISKEERKIIIKEKLKKIAEKEKLIVDSNKNVKRGTAKPKVKITLKNRGDFLRYEVPRISKRPSSKSIEKTKSSNDKANRATSTCEADVPESVIHNIEMNISKNTVNNVATSLEPSL